MVATLALAACGGDDVGGSGSGPNDDDGTAGSGSDGDTTADMPTGGSESGSDGADSSTTSGDDATSITDSSDSGSESGSTGAIVPVVCGEVECAPDELCVVPGIDCDYSPCKEEPPGEAEFFDPPPFCAPVPKACAADDETCLAGELCTDSVDAMLVDGVLSCPAEAADCFCDL